MVGTRSETGLRFVIHRWRRSDLRDLGVVLQLLQLALAVRDELLQHGVVAVHAVLPLGQLHAPVQLLHVQQDVLQRHCQGGDRSSLTAGKRNIKIKNKWHGIWPR